MMNRTDQIFTALQTIEAVTMQLGTVIAPLNELNSEAVSQIQQGVEAIERQLVLIRNQTDTAITQEKRASDSGRSD